jgi:hypothetical protein
MLGISRGTPVTALKLTSEDPARSGAVGSSEQNASGKHLYLLRARALIRLDSR